MFNNLKITAVVVVYNKSIDGSLTCAGIAACSRDIDVVVVDNSDRDFGNREVCSRLGYRYISMGGNAGLSKAYNAAIDASPDSDVFVLLDDDTEVDSDYFDALIKAANSNSEVDIFAPVMVGQDGVIYSPNNSSFMRNEFMASANEEPVQSRFNAIASCLALRSRVFSEYRFNEKLFVDQIDQNLCDDLREQGRRFMKLNVVIKQNFYQRGDGLTAEQGWRRLSLRIVDLMRYSRMKGGKYVLLGYAKCCGLGLQISKKTGSPAVFGKAFVLSTSLLVKPR